jgi:hypothetical protein
LDAVQAGGKLASGSAIYSSFPYDPGMGGANWATWKFMNSQTLDPAAGFIFMSPPRPITPFKVDVEDSYKAIFATTERFTASAHQTISVPSAERPDSLVTLRDRGAKVLLYHGVSDAIFSETDTRAWVDRANASVQGSRFVRYFPVPGMNHCGAGPAADQFDALTPLVDWVEKGQAPAAITAQVRGVGNAAAVNAELPKDWSPTRTRPLCAYPTVARYKGGNREVASSFACEP